MKRTTCCLCVDALANLVAANGAPAAESVKVEFLNSGKVLPANLPFSEAVRVGDLLLLSGQIGLIPGSMKLVDGGMKAEAKQVMENIKTSLDAIPARSALGANGLALGARVEVECVAAK
jgi:2-iminobutanoate/2-iminopropanoate deaminase